MIKCSICSNVFVSYVCSDVEDFSRSSVVSNQLQMLDLALEDVP